MTIASLPGKRQWDYDEEDDDDDDDDDDDNGGDDDHEGNLDDAKDCYLHTEEVLPSPTHGLLRMSIWSDWKWE